MPQFAFYFISLIYQAILKYGHLNFTLEILEYCASAVLLQREQHYLNLFKPKYNLNPTAGSPLGRKHTKETIMREIRLGKKISEETRAKIAKAGFLFLKSQGSQPPPAFRDGGDSLDTVRFTYICINLQVWGESKAWYFLYSTSKR
jgi:hypothetical protein